jgi:aspartate/methionine/tyrosine aminotransferase
MPALEINGDYNYGYAPLKEAIAEKHDVDPDCVVTAFGTSMANHLAFATMLEPGDEVLLERPTYGLIVDALRYVGATLKPIRRRPESGWALDLNEVILAITPKTRLIVITNPHNPTSVLTPELLLIEIGEIAREAGARVLVDEVYLDAVYEHTPRTSFHLGPQFVVTNSLTKLYGVSGLRCGWIFAEPALARAMWRLNDLLPQLRVSRRAAQPGRPAESPDGARPRAGGETDRRLLTEFLAREAAVDAVSTNWGTTSFLRLTRGNADAFLETLRVAHDTSAVPGRFFGAADHFRIGMGVNSDMFAEGLRRVSLHLRNHVQ